MYWQTVFLFDITILGDSALKSIFCLSILSEKVNQHLCSWMTVHVIVNNLTLVTLPAHSSHWKAPRSKTTKYQFAMVFVASTLCSVLSLGCTVRGPWTNSARGHKHVLELAYSKCCVLKKMHDICVITYISKHDTKNFIFLFYFFKEQHCIVIVYLISVQAQQITALLTMVSSNSGQSMAVNIVWLCLVRAWPFTGTHWFQVGLIFPSPIGGLSSA